MLLSAKDRLITSEDNGWPNALARGVYLFVVDYIYYK